MRVMLGSAVRTPFGRAKRAIAVRRRGAFTGPGRKTGPAVLSGADTRGRTQNDPREEDQL